jgi:hypothetical protein
VQPEQAPTVAGSGTTSLLSQNIARVAKWNTTATRHVNLGTALMAVLREENGYAYVAGTRVIYRGTAVILGVGYFLLYSLHIIAW